MDLIKHKRRKIDSIKNKWDKKGMFLKARCSSKAWRRRRRIGGS